MADYIKDVTNLTNHVDVESGAGTITNWIDQINVGGTTYDIATHHSIKFKNGSGDNNGVIWNGRTDIEVIIPTISDFVQSPIEFAGTVNKDGEISWNQGFSEAKTGYLVFVTEDCTFKVSSTETTGIACEAGDMAIFDGSKWNIVSGENQVQIVTTSGSTSTDGNTTTIAIGDAKDILTIEGKKLALSIDYENFNNHIEPIPGNLEDVIFETMTVDPIGIKLDKTDVSITIGEEKTFENAISLENGDVTFTNGTGLINNIVWGTFDPGTQTTSQGNSQQSLSVSGGSLGLTSDQNNKEANAFVDSVRINAVTFVEAKNGENGSIHTVDSITSGTGQSFVNGIHITGTDEIADFTISGFITTDTENVKFVEGIEGDLSPVTSITTGSIEKTVGDDFVTGFSNEGSTGDVVSNVTVTPNSTSVLNNATVNNHVLSFGSTNVINNVTTDVKYKSVTKGKYEYTAPVATTTSFVTSGFKSGADLKFTFDKSDETTYTFTSKDWKLNTPELSVTYGKYDFINSGMTATVPANTFIASVTPGNLPSLGTSTVNTVDISGKVGTKLTTQEITFNALISNTFTSGEYSLSTVDAESGDIQVGNYGELGAVIATVDLGGYITGINFK